MARPMGESKDGVPRLDFDRRLKLEFHIVTNLSRPAERVAAFYNQRGKAEQYIKEGENAIKWTRLSCRKFRDNAVRLQLHALAGPSHFNWPRLPSQEAYSRKSWA